MRTVYPHQPVEEDLELPAVAEASPPDSQVLHQPQVLHLVAYNVLVKQSYRERSR